MNNKVKIHQFDPVIYPYKIWVAVCNDIKVIREQFSNWDESEITYEISDTYNAFTDEVRLKGKTKYYGSLICFISENDLTVGKIAHESVHAAKHLFEFIRAEVRPHEPFEYLVGWIADCCEQVKLNKFK